MAANIDVAEAWITTDAVASHIDVADVWITASSGGPTADAGPDQDSIEPWDTVNLNGSGSTGTITGYSWTQTDGTTVTITDAGTAYPSFEAPGTIDGDTLTFALTVTDGSNTSAPDTVDITVMAVTERAVIGGAEVPMRMMQVKQPPPVPPGPDDYLIGQVVNNGYGTSLSLSYASQTGNTLLLLVGSPGSNTITDDAGNTWTLLADTVAAGATSTQAQGQAYICIDASPVTSVTITRGDSSNLVASLTEWQNITAVNDSSAKLSTDGDATVDAAVGDLIVGAEFAYSSDGSADTATGYDALAEAVRGTIVLSAGSLVATVAGTQAPDWSRSAGSAIAYITVALTTA